MRAPSVFVRELSPQEGERLRRVSRRAKHFSTRQRASILLASATKHTAPRIASMWRTDESRVRKVIHDFDERGFDSLRPDYRGGRPAGSPPRSASGSWPWPMPVPTPRGCRSRAGRCPSWRPTWQSGRSARSRPPIWAGCCRGRPLVPAHPLLEGLAGPRLRGQGGPPAVALRAGSRGWGGDLLRSAGPALAQTHPRLRLGRAPPPGAPPGDLQSPPRCALRLRSARRPPRPPAAAAHAPPPRPGHALLHAPAPALLPAPDPPLLGSGQAFGQLDADIREFAANNNIELVPLPTHASYLNRIEAHFRPLTEFVVNNADYLDRDAFAHALANHLRHRNGPDRDRRIADRERKLTIAARPMEFQVRHSEKAH